MGKGKIVVLEERMEERPAEDPIPLLAAAYLQLPDIYRQVGYHWSRCGQQESFQRVHDMMIDYIRKVGPENIPRLLDARPKYSSRVDISQVSNLEKMYLK